MNEGVAMTTPSRIMLPSWAHLLAWLHGEESTIAVDIAVKRRRKGKKGRRK